LEREKEKKEKKPSLVVYAEVSAEAMQLDALCRSYAT
jgi:hypothetical protein